MLLRVPADATQTAISHAICTTCTIHGRSMDNRNGPH